MAAAAARCATGAASARAARRAADAAAATWLAAPSARLAGATPARITASRAGAASAAATAAVRRAADASTTSRVAATASRRAADAACITASRAGAASTAGTRALRRAANATRGTASRARASSASACRRLAGAPRVTAASGRTAGPAAAWPGADARFAGRPARARDARHASARGRLAASAARGAGSRRGGHVQALARARVPVAHRARVGLAEGARRAARREPTSHRAVPASVPRLAALGAVPRRGRADPADGAAVRGRVLRGHAGAAALSRHHPWRGGGLPLPGVLVPAQALDALAPAAARADEGVDRVHGGAVPRVPDPDRLGARGSRGGARR